MCKGIGKSEFAAQISLFTLYSCSFFGFKPIIADRFIDVFLQQDLVA